MYVYIHLHTYIHICTNDNSNTDGHPTIPKALNSGTPHFPEHTTLYIQVSLQVLLAVSENSQNRKAQVPGSTSTSWDATPLSCICVKHSSRRSFPLQGRAPIRMTLMSKCVPVTHWEAPANLLKVSIMGGLFPK